MSLSFLSGADSESSQPTSGMPADASAQHKSLSSTPSILMVNYRATQTTKTVAGRRWTSLGKGVDVNLVLVGKSGWKMEEFEKRLKSPLNWGVACSGWNSDEYLEKVYNASAAVPMASKMKAWACYCGGCTPWQTTHPGIFPVFREIAGDNAFYFKGLQSEEPQHGSWNYSYRAGTVPVSAGIRCSTWKESAVMLLTRLPLTLNADWPSWMACHPQE